MANIVKLIEDNCTNKKGFIQSQSINKYFKANKEIMERFHKETKFLINNESLVEKFKALQLGLSKYPSCKICKKEVPKFNRKVCSIKCSTKNSRICLNIKLNNMSKEELELYKSESLKKQEKTMLDKYGETTSLRIPQFKKKMKETLMKKYGEDNAMKVKEISKKAILTKRAIYGNKLEDIFTKQKKTMLRKYGVEYPLQNKDSMAKLKKTNLERYNVEYVLENKDIQNKIRLTFLQKYGTEYPLRNKNVMDKLKITNLNKYGVTCVFQNNNIKEKILKTQIDRYGKLFNFAHIDHKLRSEATNLKRYGVKNYFEIINENNLGYILSKKEYTLPSGKEIILQGYEPIVMTELLEKYSEEDILFKRIDMPKIFYIGEDNKKHRYFPDFFIPKDNLIIEVKSEYTMIVDFYKNMLKFIAVKNMGYRFKLEVRKL